jgi:hypothetical protein
MSTSTKSSFASETRNARDALNIAYLMLAFDPMGCRKGSQTLEDRRARFLRVFGCWLACLVDGVTPVACGRALKLNDPADVSTWLSYVETPPFDTSRHLATFVNLYLQRVGGGDIPPNYVHLRETAFLQFIRCVKVDTQVNVAAQAVLIGALNEPPSIVLPQSPAPESRLPVVPASPAST